MGRFHCSIHECDGSISGDAGAADLADARNRAIVMAREMMASEIRQGRLCLSCWVVISDGDGRTVETLHFGETVTIAGLEPGCAASAGNSVAAG